MILENNFIATLTKVKPYTDPSQIPISFCYGDKMYRGLDQELFHPTVERRHIDANITRKVITGRLEDGLEVRVEYTEYRDYPAVEWYAEFCNRSDKNSKVLTKVRLIDEVYPGENPVLLHSNGDTVTYQGFEIYRTPVDADGIELVSEDGSPCKGIFPFMRLMHEGGGVNLAVGWPGNWTGQIQQTKEGTAVWFGQAVLEMYLRPGEVIRAPRVLAIGYNGDEADGRKQWRHFYMDHILPKENGKPLGPMSVMTWRGGGIEYTKATEENQLGAIDTFLKKGFKPDIWWLDAGWYPCNLKWEAAGTWRPNPEHFPNGLGPIGKKCEENDIRFLLWFELERVTGGSELEVEHPEWMLRRKDENGNNEWTSMLKLADDDCLNWCIERVDSLIKDSHVKIYRQDFNCHNPARFWKDSEEEGRAGALENHHIQNLLTFWDTLVERNPGLWIDNCSSGGRRNDYELMKRSVPLHYTDIGYGVHPEKQQQYRVLFEWIPYFRSMGYSWDDENGNYDGETSPFNSVCPDKFATYTAFAPAIDQKMQPDFSDEEMEMAKEMIEIWRPAAELMLKGDYYPLVESHKSAKEYYACQFDDPVSGEGFIQVIRNVLVEEDTVTIYPHTEDGAEYLFTCMDPVQSMELTAEDLQGGFTVSIPKRSSIVWYYKRKN